MDPESRQDNLDGSQEETCIEDSTGSEQEVQAEDNSMAAAVDTLPLGISSPDEGSPSSIKDRLKQFDSMSQQVDERLSIEKKVKEEAARVRIIETSSVISATCPNCYNSFSYFDLLLAVFFFLTIESMYVVFYCSVEKNEKSS